MKKIMKRLLTGVLSLATVFTTLPASQVQAAEKQYWTDAQEGASKKAAPKKKAAEEPKPEPQPQEEKALTLEDVRAVCADKSRKGFTAQPKRAAAYGEQLVVS